MEGTKKVVLFSGVSGIILMTIFLFVLFIKKYKKKTIYPIQKIAWKKLPELKSIPLNVQLQSTEKFRSSEEESVSSIDSEFSTIKEKRDDMIDPLLGVLHTSRQTKARLSEVKDLQNTIILETALVWATNDESLTVMLPYVEPLLSKNVKTFLTLKIESTRKSEKNVSKFEDKKECHSKKGLIFCFKGMTLEEAQSCYIRLEASERKHRLSKEQILSRGILSLKKSVLIPNTPLNLYSQLTLLKDKSGSSHEQTFGTLWISLRCCFVGQVSGNFILEIKRAENLPVLKSGGSYRTEVFLVRKEKKIQYFCSSSRHGHSPEWNSSFSFDVSINNISEYSLDFIIVKMGKISGSKRIGKYSLTERGKESKTSFWETVIEIIGEEILFKRELKNPSDKDEFPIIEDKLLGQLSLTLSESTNLSSRDKMAEFEITPNCLASFQFEKSGGEYKLEIVVEEKKRSLFQFTTMTSQCDSLQWISPQSFKVTRDKIPNLSLTVTLIRQGRLKKSSKLGRAVIEPRVFREWSEEASNTPSTEWFPMYKL